MAEQEINYSELLEKLKNIKAGDSINIKSSNPDYSGIYKCALATKASLGFLGQKNFRIKLSEDDLKEKKIENITSIDSTDQKPKTEKTIKLIPKLASKDSKLIIGLESMVRYRKDYERLFPYKDQKESIKEQLLNSNRYKFNTDKLDFILEKKAEEIIDFSLRSKINFSYRKPLIENFKNNDYSSFIIKPIVKDVQKIYIKNQTIIDADNADKTIYPDLYFSNVEEELKALENHSKYYKDANSTKLNKDGTSKFYKYTKQQYDQNNNHLYVSNEDGENYYYLNRTYFNEKPDLTDEDRKQPIISYYELEKPLETNQVIYRSCLEYPSYQRCNRLIIPGPKDFRINNNNYLQSRIADGNTYTLEDNLSNRLITDRKTKQGSIISCSGTGKTTELFYSTATNKKEHKESDYNRSIICPPSKKIHTEGEKLNITGILIKSINDFQPEFTNNNLKNIEPKIDNKEFLKYYGTTSIIKFNQIKNIGYNLVDQIKINETNIMNINTNSILKNYNVYQNINNANFLDYSKNNFIYFNTNPKIKDPKVEDSDPKVEDSDPKVEDSDPKVEDSDPTIEDSDPKIEDLKIDDKKLTYCLDKIIPKPIDIFKNIEPNNLKKCENFKEFDKILSKYDLSIYNFSRDQINSINIKLLLQNAIFKNKRYSNYLKLQKEYSINISNKAISLFDLIIKNKKFIEENDTSPEILDNIDIYYENLIKNIVKKIYQNVKNIYTYNDLVNIHKDYLNIIYSVQPDEVDSDPDTIYKDILYNIIKYIINKNKYDIKFYYNLIYKNIIDYKNIFSTKEQAIMDHIYKIYDINNSLFLNKFTNKNNLSSNDLTIINLIYHLKNSFDNGKLIYDYMSYLNKVKNLRLIKNQLSILSKENYEITQPDGWSNLNQEERDQYNLELIKIKTKEYERIVHDFNEQKRLLNFMHTKCENLEVVKVYKNKDHIINDNKLADLYYDSVFDTTKSDIEDIKHLLNKLDYDNFTIDDDRLIKEKLIYKYIFSSDDEIKRKIDNIKENINKNEENQKRKVLNGNFALLYTANQRILYKYIKGIWVPLNRQDIINAKDEKKNENCTFKKEFLEHILTFDFNNLVNQEHQFIEALSQEQEREQGQLQSNDIDLDIHSNTSIYPNNISVPKKFLSLIYKATKLKSDITLLKNTLHSERLLTESIEDLEKYINNEIENRNTIIKNKNNFVDDIITDNPKIDSTKKIMNKYRKMWRDAVNITDMDHRFNEIEKIINKYGILKKKSSDNTGINENFYYWDIPLIEEEMCCVHYYDLVDIAYKDNNTREKILDKVKRDYCKLENHRYVCQFCSETICYENDSAFEGFEGDEVINFRQKNYEFDRMDNQLDESKYLSYDNDDIKQSILNTLNLYCETIGLTLKIQDIKFIVENSETTIKSFNISSAQFKKDSTDKTINYINYKKEVESFKEEFKVDKIIFEYLSGGQYFEKIRAWDKNLKKVLKEEYSKVIENKKYLSKMQKYITKNQFDCIILGRNISQIYHLNYMSYLSTINLSIILQYLLKVIFYSIPKYNIKGTGDEKKAKLVFFGLDYENADYSIEYLLKFITNKFIIKTNKFKQEEEEESKIIYWDTIRQIYNKNKRETFPDDEYENFKNLGWNFVKEYIEKNPAIIERENNFRIKYEQYIENLIKIKQDIIDKENEWIEFKPTLNINYDHVSESLPEIEPLINTYRDTERTPATLPQLLNLKKEIVDLSKKYSEKLVLLLNKKINEINEYSQESKDVLISKISYLSNCCSNYIGNNYIDFFKSDEKIQKLLETIQNANNFIKNINTFDNNIIQFTEYNTNSYENNYRTLLDYTNIDDKETAIFKELFPEPNTNDLYLLHLQKQIENINLTIITNDFTTIDSTTDILKTIDFTTNKTELVGKRRIWQDIKEYDVYIINDIYTEYAQQTEFLPDNKLSNEDLIEHLKDKLIEKYPLIDDQIYLENRAKMLINVYNNSNKEEFGLVKIDKISNQYDFQIKNKIKFIIQTKTIEELKNMILDSDQKNVLNKDFNYITDFTRINNFYKIELEYMKKIQDYINILFNRPIFGELIDNYNESEQTDQDKTNFIEDILDLTTLNYIPEIEDIAYTYNLSNKTDQDKREFIEELFRIEDLKILNINYMPKLEQYVTEYININEPTEENRKNFRKNILELNKEYFDEENYVPNDEDIDKLIAMKIRELVNSDPNRVAGSFSGDNKIILAEKKEIEGRRFAEAEIEEYLSLLECMGTHIEIKKYERESIDNQLIIENYTNKETNRETKDELTFRNSQLDDKHSSLQIETYNKYSRLIINLLRILYYQINNKFLEKNIGSIVNYIDEDGNVKIGKIIGINSLKNSPLSYKTYNLKIDSDIIFSVPSSEDVSDGRRFIINRLESDTTPLMFGELLDKSVESDDPELKKLKKEKKTRPINSNNKPWWTCEHFEIINKKETCPTLIYIHTEKDDEHLNELKDYYYNSIDNIIEKLRSKKNNLKTEADKERDIDKKSALERSFENNIVELMNKIHYYIERSEIFFNLFDLLVSKRNSMNTLETISLLGNEEILNISKYIFYKLLIFIFKPLEDHDNKHLDNNEVLNIIKLEICDIVFFKGISNLEQSIKISDKKIKDLFDKEKSRRSNKRKEDHNRMGKEEQRVKQLMRAFNLGSLFKDEEENDYIEDIDGETRQGVQKPGSGGEDDPDPDNPYGVSGEENEDDDPFAMGIDELDPNNNDGNHDD